MKKKVYVLVISKYFPAYHPKAGEETHFMSKILLNFDKVVMQDEYGNQFPSNDSHDSKCAAAIVREMGFEPKLHTIRNSYALWAARAEKINRGEAVLSLRQWSGKPYRSKQEEFLRLEKIKVQQIRILKVPLIVVPYGTHPIFGKVENCFPFDLDELAKNDGLSTDDFRAWFQMDRKMFQFDGCIIHFTENFKY